MARYRDHQKACRVHRGDASSLRRHHLIRTWLPLEPLVPDECRLPVAYEEAPMARLGAVTEPRAHLSPTKMTLQSQRMAFCDSSHHVNHDDASSGQSAHRLRQNLVRLCFRMPFRRQNRCCPWKFPSHVAPEGAPCGSYCSHKTGATDPFGLSEQDTPDDYRKRRIWTLCTRPIMSAKATV